MYAVSDAFHAAIRRGPTVTAKAEFMLDGEVIGEVPILAGEVSEDSTALIRRRASLVLSAADGSLEVPGPTYDTSPLWPTGNEVRVWSGVVFEDGTTEWCPLGVYRISRPRMTRTTEDLGIAVDAYDRSRAIGRNRFTEVYGVAAGQDYATAIKALIQNRMSSSLALALNDSDFVFMVTDGSLGGSTFVTPQLTFVPGDDPWEKAVEMAKSFGAELFFNGLGQCVLRPEPNPAYTPSVFDYVAGPDATFTEIARDLDDEQAYNGVIATGSNTGNITIPRGEAWDTDPNSPTYYDPLRPQQSKYGPVPHFMNSQYIGTDAQATEAAKAQLQKVIGIMETVDLQAVAHPAHEGGDVISIKEEMTGLDNVYVLDQYRVGLGYTSNMSGTTRKRRSA